MRGTSTLLTLLLSTSSLTINTAVAHQQHAAGLGEHETTAVTSPRNLRSNSIGPEFGSGSVLLSPRTNEHRHRHHKYEEAEEEEEEEVLPTKKLLQIRGGIGGGGHGGSDGGGDDGGDGEGGEGDGEGGDDEGDGGDGGDNSNDASSSRLLDANVKQLMLLVGSAAAYALS